MLTCQQLIEFLDRYPAGELPLRTRLAFRMHLALCRHCRAYLDSYRKTMHVMRAALRDDAPAPVEPPAPPAELVEAVLKSRPRTPPAADA